MADKLYRVSLDTLLWVKRTMNCHPAWESMKYAAEHTKEMWQYGRRFRSSSVTAKYVIAMQTFSGLNQRWVEDNMRWS